MAATVVKGSNKLGILRKRIKFHVIKKEVGVSDNGNILDNEICKTYTSERQ